MSHHLPEPRDVLGYAVTPAPIGEAVAWADDTITQGQYAAIVTANPEMLMQARQHTGLNNALQQAKLIIPDGAGVIWALNTLYDIPATRLPGIELAESLLARAAQAGWRVALIGASAEVVTETVIRLEEGFHGINIVYAHHGFVKDAHTLIPEVLSYQPNLVLVALGVPRQELWIVELLQQFKEHTSNNAPTQNSPNTAGLIAMGVGGSFDVWSGMKDRAPQAYRKLNLEWFYRIKTEPWRLKRVWKSLPGFMLLILRQKWFGSIERQ